MGVPAPEPNGQERQPPVPPMRLLVPTALLIVALAGCTAPDDAPADPLFGTCPQWVGGDWAWDRDVTLTGNDTTTFLPVGDDGPITDLAGAPLDRYTIHFRNVTVDGTVEVRAFADEAGRRIAFTDYRNPDAPTSLLFASLETGADLELNIYLSPVAHGSAPSPDGLRLQWTGASGSADVLVTAGYKVCGVPL